MRAFAGRAGGIVLLLATAWLATLVVAAAWSVVADIGIRESWPPTALIVGALALFGGGNLLSRMTTLESSQFGVSMDRHGRDDNVDRVEMAQLTPLGVGLLVGVPLIIAGGLLL